MKLENVTYAVNVKNKLPLPPSFRQFSTSELAALKLHRRASVDFYSLINFISPFTSIAINVSSNFISG